MRNTPYAPALALALACVLAACSDKEEPVAQQSAEPAPAEAPVRAAATEPAATPPATTPAPTASVPAADAAAFWGELDKIAAGSHRSEKNRARDAYRHPKETLQFFGIAPGMRVIEIWPGGGWYTELLAPLMRGNGSFVAAFWDDTVKGQPDYRYRLANEFKTMLYNNPALYDQVEIENFTPPSEAGLGAPGTADAVVTFRNVHNWIGEKENAAPAVFKAFFEVLKPGGVLGVVEHRAAAGKSAEESFKSGYLSEDAVIKLATDAGFVLVEKSEVNANPKDTKDHPEGVWTLPPSLALGDKDKAKYLAIGESDRMTLKFQKPVP